MLVYFVGSSKHTTTEAPFLQKIVDTIDNAGSQLTFDWVGDSVDVKNEKALEKRFSNQMEALKKADVVIVEATSFGFEQGFFVSRAVTNKKPTLLLYKNNDDATLLAGVKDHYLTTGRYETEDEMQKHITKFLRDNVLTTKDLRFNFFIDRQIYNFLRETSYETGRSKSEIIRHLLEEEIDKQES